MTKIKFTSEIVVELQNHLGSDEDIARAAWVSSGNDDLFPTPKRLRGVIRALMREKHGTPFEAGYFDYYIYAPRGVRDETRTHRHCSVSSASLRYREIEPVLWIPPPHRPLEKAPGFKQIQPVYQPYSAEKYDQYVHCLKQGYEATYQWLDTMKGLGITETEAQRWLSHDGLMIPFKARFNPRSLMHFISLRTHEATANHPSYPMWEIEQVARKMETYFAEQLPLTYEAWLDNGREAP